MVVWMGAHPMQVGKRWCNHTAGCFLVARGSRLPGEPREEQQEDTAVSSLGAVAAARAAAAAAVAAVVVAVVVQEVQVWLGEPATGEQESQVVRQRVCLVAERPDHQEQPRECPASLRCPLMVEHGLLRTPEG